MKKIHYLLIALCLTHTLTACSQKQRSNVHHSSQNNRQVTVQPQLRPFSTQPQITQHRSQYSFQQTSSSAVINHQRTRIVQIANSTIGTPYRWGGDSPRKGFDCSGLMSYIHKNALGLKIPRTAAQQRHASRTINYSQLQPGDMLFFKTGKRTNHVGVYVGNRKFVHAATGSKHVKVASMDSSYWHKHFIKFGTFL